MAEQNRSERVRDIMTRDPRCVTTNQKLSDVARLMRDEDCGAVPVIAGESDRKIIGMVTDRDIVIRVVAEGKNPTDTAVETAMTKQVYSVKEDDPVDQVFRVMSDNQVRRVPVVDDRGMIVGIVAQADIATDTEDMRKVARTVEEISEGKGNR